MNPWSNLDQSVRHSKVTGFVSDQEGSFVNVMGRICHARTRMQGFEESIRDSSSLWMGCLNMIRHDLIRCCLNRVLLLLIACIN